MNSFPDKKLLLVVCLLLGLLSCIVGCISVMPYINLKGNPNGDPVRGLTITMDVNQREEFFTQMRKFADKHALEFIVSFYDADKKLFLVEINGDGFHISASDVPNTPTEIDIGFYNDASPPTSLKTFDELYKDLKSFLGKIPDVAIKEKLKYLRITMNENQREEIFVGLFTLLQKFADKHSLQFTVTSYDPKIKVFLIEMHGEGFRITSEAVRSSPEEFDVNFDIDFDDGIPTLTSQETVDELFNDINSFLGEIPNATITEQK